LFQNEPGNKMQTYPQQKLFCIGLNKTGTTSIGDAFRILGYSRLGWRGNISAPLTLRVHEGKLDGFMPLLMQYDAFEDLPWPLIYDKVDSWYPNAKFVLTVRKNEDVWLKSIQKHIARGSNWVGHFLIYGSYDPVKDAEMYLAKYRAHNEAVRAHFAGRPDKMIEMCFEDGDGWDKLCDFLGIKQRPQQPFPHANSAATQEAKMVDRGMSTGNDETGKMKTPIRNSVKEM
jgi:Sulfotransferase domain